MIDLLWLDLETTGLDPQHDSILEIAVARAPINDPFNYVQLLNRVAKHSGYWLSDFIRDMHTKNGLLKECRTGDSLLDIEEVLLDFIPMLPKNDRPVLAGSSIHFDQAFIKFHMPELYSRLSHRLYDVSSVRLFAESLGAPDFRGEGDSTHRAMSDIIDSVELAKKYATWFETPSEWREYAEAA